MRSLLALLGQAPPYQTLVSRLDAGEREQWVEGLIGSARSYLIAALSRSWPAPIVVVTASSERAEEIWADLSILLAPGEGSSADSPLRLFPPLETLLYEGISVDRERVGQRLATLEALLRNEVRLVVTPLSALLHRTVPRHYLQGSTLILRTGDEIPPKKLCEQLLDLGYEPRSMVLAPGHLSARGGIVDVFPVTAPLPVRVEFFGDEIESLRTFDVNSQRSVSHLSALTITVPREAAGRAELHPDSLGRIHQALAEQEQSLRAAGRDLDARRLRAKVEADLQRLQAGEPFDGMEHYLPYLYPTLDTLLDYVGPKALFFIDGPEHLSERAEQLAAEVERVYEARVARGSLLKLPTSLYLPFTASDPPWRAWPTVYLTQEASPRDPTTDHETTDHETTRPRDHETTDHRPRDHRSGIRGQWSVVSGPWSVVSGQWSEGVPLHFESHPLPEFHGQFEVLAEELNRLRAAQWRVLTTTNQTERVRQLLATHRVPNAFVSEEDVVPQPGQIQITRRRLSQGFALPSLRLAVLTDQEVFGWRERRQLPRRRTTLRATALASLTELRVGDLVVHVAYGIGEYAGLVKKSVDGVEQDYIAINYAGSDRLFVPITQLHRIQKYIGADGHAPALNSLSGPHWTQTKRRVKESALAVAKELVELYAKRQHVLGHAFSPDSDWQREMEAAFIYEETPDQQEAIVEVKKNMEDERPMDRLLCGDVGYGKTEVAIRAAFKACLDDKQVAVLVPTTVLAQQHYNTFRERLSAYPVRIEMLSRFCSEKEQEQIVADLAAGKVDIVIGTHRLIQPDIAFRDLGLVIIDEEQRFGVRHKERLKQLRTEVDVLTMTATPIPRTLHSSLIGVRDMSLIMDPPEGRMPIQTYVLERDDEVVREAILRELDRDGQVYFVHNRVRTIGRVKRWLESLVPSARIGVGHGQLPEPELERVMLDFFAGRYDILTCTTIIESGLDIPNVNTIIIDDCDRFGLAQLYQLRGRVGRSTRQAYALLLYQPSKTLTPAAAQRLEAIRELTELGSGFQLALRDLEIRGAGNLLGPEQHGFMAQVGFELYTQLLTEAIRTLKGEETTASRLDVTLDLPIPAELSGTYVPDVSQRLDLYRRLAAVENHEQATELEQELQDRFGPLPPPTQNLLRLVRLKVDCDRTGIGAIALHPEDRSLLVLTFAPEATLEPREKLRFAQALGRIYRGQLKMTLRANDLRVRLPIRRPDFILRETELLVQRIALARAEL